MIRSLRIAGIGPHTDTVLPFPKPLSSHELRGASASGKSTALEAVCFVLWGTDSSGKPFPVEAIRRDADAAVVELTLGSGLTLRRSMDRGRKHKRFVVRHGEETRYTTEEDFRGALGDVLGRRVRADKSDIDLARLVIAPMAWTDLLSGTARGLRDVLLAVLPPSDLRAEVAAGMATRRQELRRDDPLDVKAAETLRRDANTAHGHAVGARDAARANVGRLEQPIEGGPTEEAVRNARATRDAAEAWRRYDTAVESHVEHEQRRAARNQERDTWRQARTELDAREPAYDAAVHKAKAAAVERVAGIVAGERKGVSALEQEIATLRGRLEATRAAEERARATPEVQAVAAAIRGTVDAVVPLQSFDSPNLTRSAAEALGVCRECGQPLPARSAS